MGRGPWIPAARRVLAACLVGLAATLVVAVPAAQGLERSKRATSEVRKWSSKKSFTAPYALVEVLHEGRHLTRTPITRCRGSYADREITVQISTCGHRWRVRSAYVSMSGKRERFRIVFAPRERAPREG